MPVSQGTTPPVAPIVPDPWPPYAPDKKTDVRVRDVRTMCTAWDGICLVVVDTLGLLLAVVVHAADVRDREGAKPVLAKLRVASLGWR